MSEEMLSRAAQKVNLVDTSTSPRESPSPGQGRPTNLVDPAWQNRTEVFDFQFGPIRFGQFSIKSISLVSNPFVADPELAIPLARAAAEGCQAVVISAKPVDRRFASMCFDRGALRYAARYGDRYIVDLGGPFAEYLKKFSKKARGNLQRTVKKIATANGGSVDFREYRSPPAIMAFRDIAIAISRRSYKKNTGWGFLETEEFARQLEADARADKVRGYALMIEDEPAAYAFCRIDHHVIVYKHIGYDEKFTQYSPGTALLYLMLERLFHEREFRLLDFDGTEYYPYKEFFSTRAIRCARVAWFRPTARSLALVIAHWVVTASWRLAAALRGLTRRSRREWVSARQHIHQARRSIRST